ncbi:hypothetical protein GQ55_3G106700 [Panicum hallii var. hallii]|uniref:Agenet domain-containing protein n=1 Tax=Panicum hallii var. hallii TaxID=1504633 RepID=A0A2T7E7Y9_9POAL|nr:hypothetical protein GQ55_3G106700 [Panicum hallii var. hallii]
MHSGAAIGDGARRGVDHRRRGRRRRSAAAPASALIDRCTTLPVLDIRVNESAGYLEYYLEYIDYTSEEKEWVQVFEKNPASSNKNSRESSQLMIRPSFPQWCYGHEVPEQFPNSDVTAVVDEACKVGDLVDWLNEGCYWSGTITKLLDEDRVEVKLPAPPIGEGKRYPANRNDLRPTLEWSLINGWTVPLSQANKKSWHVARLLQHSKSESEKSTSYEESLSDDEYGDNSGGVQLSGCTASSTSQGGPVALAPPSATNSASSPEAQKDGNLPSAENLKPSSTSKSPDPSHNTQSASTSRRPAGTRVTGNQEPGTGISSMQEQGGSLVEAEADDDGPDEFLEKLDTLEAKLKHLIKRTQVE